MSLDPILWALKDAPVADVYERAILTVLAETADDDGCAAFPSIATIAERAMCSSRQATRVVQELLGRGLLGLGDQEAARYLPARHRPTVYDLLIPYSWFGSVDRINDGRERKGRPPLTPESRPAIASAPGKHRRSDHGKKKPTSARTIPRADYQSPLENREVSEGGLPVTPVRGDYQSNSGVTGSQTNHPIEQTSPKEKDTRAQRELFTPDPTVTGPDASPAGSVTDHLDALFDEFYDSYPRRVGRKEARRKFETALKTGVTAREVIDGARRYAEAMTGTPARFVKHPATWLHQGCWADEHPAPETQPVGNNGYQPYRNPVDQDAYYTPEW